ncbi:uncharacterized protein LOC126978865 [Leptidea sinapis]|uniref:uncharacterized protein LOC126978865 n=1 Tax=Leptidea sinapis TaxID=189913 RepID=UPI0021C40DBE|nr:uncharacterized protein LOC126978865 [Leptidea sinapis]
MSATGTQIETLMDFMMKNPDLARSLIHSVEGRVQSKRLWDNITSHLNSLGGAVKTVQQWKKVWADKKYLAKKANAAALRSATGTGGGPPTAGILSQNDLKVIAVMGHGFGEPNIPGCNVPAFPEPLEQPTPMTITETISNTSTNKKTLEATPDIDSEVHNIQASRRPRRRVRVSQPDIKQQILRLEVDKRDILAGILEELKELNNNLKYIFEKLWSLFYLNIYMYKNLCLYLQQKK